MNTNKKRLIAAALLLVFAVVKLGLLGWWHAQQPKAENAACRVTEGCTLPNGAYIKFSSPVFPKQPFDILAENVPQNVQSLTVSFSMKDMDMGFNRFKLVRQADGGWQARRIFLPVCVAGRHDYLADFNFDGQVYQSEFHTAAD